MFIITYPQIYWRSALPPSLPNKLQPRPPKPGHPRDEGSNQVIGSLGGRVGSDGPTDDHEQAQLPGHGHEDVPICCHPVNKGE